MRAHFLFAQLRVVFAKQKPSGSKFTFCLFLFTEDQSLPSGSTKSHGQSTQGGSSGASVQPWSSCAPWRGHAQPPCVPPPKRDPFSLPNGHRLLAEQELTMGQAASQKVYLLSNSHKDLYRSWWWSYTWGWHILKFIFTWTCSQGWNTLCFRVSNLNRLSSPVLPHPPVSTNTTSCLLSTLPHPYICFLLVLVPTFKGEMDLYFLVQIS